MTHIVEAGALVFYYVLFVPLAFVARLVVKDPLRLAPAPDTASFWIVRSGGRYRPMTRQY